MKRNQEYISFMPGFNHIEKKRARNLRKMYRKRNKRNDSLKESSETEKDVKWIKSYPPKKKKNGDNNKQ